LCVKGYRLGTSIIGTFGLLPEIYPGRGYLYGNLAVQMQRYNARPTEMERNQPGSRRKRARLPLRLALEIKHQGGGAAVTTQSEDLSCEGLCFRADESYSLGEVLGIRLDLRALLSPREPMAVISGLARVVQAEADGLTPRFRYGCRIVSYRLEAGGGWIARVGDADAVIEGRNENPPQPLSRSRGCDAEESSSGL